MEITVKHNGTEITVKETHPDKYRHTAILYDNDIKKIERVIIVMAKEVSGLIGENEKSS